MQIKKSGIYYARSGALSLPDSRGGMLIISYFADSYKQLIYLGSENKLYTQTFIGSEIGSGWEEK